MQINNHISYNLERSLERIDEILGTPADFEELSDIPTRDKLSYTNGFYIQCYSIFIDIRGSSKLPDKYKRPTLAKIYRAYISEIVALFQSSDHCKEINIVGDGVWAIYKSSIKNDCKEVLHAAYAANSLIRSLNYKLCKRSIDPIKVGIGIDKGRALMIRAGFSGSGINDVVYMGGVVNSASKMCSYANKNNNSVIVISEAVWNDLAGLTLNTGMSIQSAFTLNTSERFYHGDLVKVDMEYWLSEQQKKSPCKR